MNKIALVTPLRDEIKNLPQLIKAVSELNVSIFCWVIVENNSTDGSKEYLHNLKSIDNVEHLHVITRDRISTSYQLGSKYASIVNEGFEYIKSQKFINMDYIGILDADSFPSVNYYNKLLNKFNNNSRLGITSGRAKEIETKRYSAHSSSWVLGSCRLWRFSCFQDAGYIVGPSADTLSVALAELKGWEVSSCTETYFYARKVGLRVDFKYYGKSAFYRGNTLFYAVLRFIKYVFKGQFIDAVNFFIGYFKDYISGVSRVENRAIREYFSKYISRRIMNKINQYD